MPHHDLDLPRDVRELVKLCSYVVTQNLAGFGIEWGEVEEALHGIEALKTRVDAERNDKYRRRWKRQVSTCESILRNPAL